MNEPQDVTQELLALVDRGGTVAMLGYLCIQGRTEGGGRICSGCTTGCDQSVLMAYDEPSVTGDG